MNSEDGLSRKLLRMIRSVERLEERTIQRLSDRALTGNDMHVIMAIGVEKPRSMSAVAKELQVTMGTLTIAVNGLVKKGYVERQRSEADRRVVLVHLTPAGVAAFMQYREKRLALAGRVTEELTAEELRLLENALDKITRLCEFREEESE